MRKKYKICKKCWRQFEDRRTAIRVGTEMLCPHCIKEFNKRKSNKIFLSEREKEYLEKKLQIEKTLLEAIFGHKKDKK